MGKSGNMERGVGKERVSVLHWLISRDLKAGATLELDAFKKKKSSVIISYFKAISYFSNLCSRSGRNENGWGCHW